MYSDSMRGLRLQMVMRALDRLVQRRQGLLELLSLEVDGMQRLVVQSFGYLSLEPKHPKTLKLHWPRRSPQSSKRYDPLYR